MLQSSSWKCLRSLAAASLIVLAANRAAAKSDTSVSAAVSERDRHTVRGGETLWSISRVHGVAIGDLMDLNNLRSTSIREGQVLKIPRTGRDIALAPTKPTSHVVSKGETFRSIARKNGITQDELERANPKVNPDAPKPGTKITIPPSAPEPPARETEGRSKPEPPATVKVKETDTLYSIAKRNGTTEKALLAANPGVKPERLRPGSTLFLPGKKPAPKKNADDDREASPKPRDERESIASAPAKDRKESRDKTEKPGTDEAKPPKPPADAARTRRYLVSVDETAQTIAEAFNISVKKLYDMNGLKAGTPLTTGQEIMVPGRATLAEQ